MHNATTEAPTHRRTITHPVVSGDLWVNQRRALLQREKELTHMRDQIARERRALPWVRVEQNYVFDASGGRQTLAELFEGRGQLMVQHFMLAPGWEQGCPSCSFMADHTDGMAVHLAARDITVVAVSRAPLADILRFRQRMGWQFNWVSANGNRFNQDFHVSFTPEERARHGGEVYYNYGMVAFPQEEAPGVSVFTKDDTTGEVFLTYSTFGRGVEVMMGAYQMIDLTPKGRDEDLLRYGMEWVRHHDRYPHARKPATAAPDTAPAGAAAPGTSEASCCASRN